MLLLKGGGGVGLRNICFAVEPSKNRGVGSVLAKYRHLQLEAKQFKLAPWLPKNSVLFFSQTIESLAKVSD